MINLETRHLLYGRVEIFTGNKDILSSVKMGIVKESECAIEGKGMISAIK